MSNRKRFLAMVLAVMMIVSTMATMGSLPATANFSDVTDEALARALGVLGDLGVVQGTGYDEDGNRLFSGTDNVTRQQFALFVARITTGTPEFYLPNANALVEAEKLFSDVKDATFAAAILFCFEEGIITGTVAPAAGVPGKFDPEANITLQQAAAMLVRALGYTSATANEIPYERVLTHATRPEVALVGNNVETEGFDLVNDLGRRASDTLTRNDMAMLLYNFLLSQYYDYGPAYDANLGRWVPTVQMTPVLGNFGIERLAGYITAVQNYAVRLDIRDYVIAGYDVSFKGDPITLRQANPATGAVQNAIELQISYGTWVEPRLNATTGAVIEAGNFKQEDIRTTFAELGWVKPATVLEHAELLGLKVDVFRYANVASARRGAAIPSSIIVGDRKPVDNSVNLTDAPTRATAASQGNRVRTQEIEKVNSLTLGTGVTGEILYFDQRGNPDLDLKYNLYAFTDSGFLVSDSGDKRNSRTWVRATGLATTTSLPISTGRTFEPDELGAGDKKSVNDPSATVETDVDENPLTDSRLRIGEGSIEKELAKFVGNKEESHYELYFVDNGYDARGNKEFFYIFVPYRFDIIGNDDPAWDTRADLGGEARYNRFDNILGVGDVGAAARVYGHEGLTVARDDGFLFTRSGHEYRDIVIKDKLARSNVVIASITGSRIGFGGTVAPVTFSFDTTGGLAVDAWQGSNTNDISGDSGIGATWRMYTDSNGIAVAMRRRSDLPGAPNSDSDYEYGFVTVTPSATVWEDSRIFNVVSVFDAKTSRVKPILVEELPANVTQGAFIAYRGEKYQEMLLLITRSLTVPNNKTALRRSEGNTRYGVVALNANGDTITSGAKQPSGLVNSSNVIGATGTSMVSNTIEATGASITSITHDDFGTAAGRAFVNNDTIFVAYSLDNNVWGTFARTNLPTTGNPVIGAGFIVKSGNNGNSAVMNAEVVFMYVNGTLASTGDIARYATILSTPHPTVVSGFGSRYAQVYGTGEIVGVYGTTLNTGTVVTLGAQDFGELYRVTGTNITSPTSLMANSGYLNSVKSITDAIKGALVDGVATNTSIIVENDNSTITYIGKLAANGYVSGSSIVMDTGELLRLTAGQNKFKTIFVRGIADTAYNAVDPGTWTEKTAEIGFRSWEETWEIIPSGDDNRLNYDRTWVVITTDTEGRVLAGTFIISGLGGGGDHYSGSVWKRD